MTKKRRQIITDSEVSRIIELTLGGYPQKVLLDGKKKSNPVVIFLHGGPGSPLPFSVGCRGMFPDITESCIMVCWDQLGCGINNRPIDDHFTIRDYVEMTRDLILEIRRMFPQNELILCGMSWGSILTLRVVTEYAVPVDRCVTYGQVLCDLTFNEEVYAALENSTMPARRKRQLAAIRQKREHDLQDGPQVMRLIRQYTEGYQCKTGEKLPIGNFLRELLTGPDYRLRDVKALFVNGYAHNRSLIQELFHVDLRENISKLSIPYTILQGSTDIVTSTRTVQKLVAQADNPLLTCEVIDRNGHIPDKRGMDRIIQVCIRGTS